MKPSCSAQWEDDLASTGEPGLANFAASLLQPLESQARGFTHGHKKVISVPRARAAHMREIFKKGDAELKAFMASLRNAVILAASSIQYDSACLPAEQLNQTVLPEPFSRKQQARSRLDGGTEIDGSVRDAIEVTESEQHGHVQIEAMLAESLNRPPRTYFLHLCSTGMGVALILPLLRCVEPSFARCAEYAQIVSALLQNMRSCGSCVDALLQNTRCAG